MVARGDGRGGSGGCVYKHGGLGEVHTARTVARTKMVVAASHQRRGQRQLRSGGKLKERLLQLRRWRKRSGGFEKHADGQTRP